MNVRLPPTRKHEPKSKQTTLHGRRNVRSRTEPKPSSPNPVQSRTPPTHNLLGDRRSRIQQGPRPNLRKPSRTPTGPDQIWLTIRLLRQVPYPLPRRTPNNRG